MELFRIIKIKILQFKLISAFLIFLLLVVTPVSINEVIELNQFNKHLKLAQDLNASEKPQEAREALQKAKEKINTTLLVKALKKEEIKQTEKEIEEIRQIVETPEPQYSATIKSTPTLNLYFFTFEATIKNVNVMPYITNIGFYECNFVDDENNKYSGSFDTEVAFNQAVLPGESQDFVTKDVGIGISGLDNTTEGLRKCFYDDKGSKQCEMITNLKIIDCNVRISTDGKQASNGWGKNPIKVVFP